MSAEHGERADACAAWVGENAAMWDARVPLHIQSAWYDVDGFRRGRLALDDIELAGLGDLRDRSVLHLQCHFGLATLSCVRLGAEACGVDFSGDAIRCARQLGLECALDAQFVHADVSRLRLERLFDVCFTSWGVLMWLPALGPWADTIARHLRPGGRFFLAECHPHFFIWDDELGLDGYRPRNPYFTRAEPVVDAEASSYVDMTVRLGRPQYRWNHPLSEIVTVLARHGLRILEMVEHPRLPWRPLPWMVPDEHPGFWRVEGDPFPVSFSLIAERERS